MAAGWTKPSACWITSWTRRPNQPDALHLSGIVAFRLGDVAKSLDQMERSLAHGIDTPLYLRNISEVYRALGRLDDALNAARRATALAPADPLCLHNLAVIQYHRLELDEALACAGPRAAASTPVCRVRIFELAEALLLRGEWAEAGRNISGAFDLPAPRR